MYVCMYVCIIYIYDVISLLDRIEHAAWGRATTGAEDRGQNGHTRNRGGWVRGAENGTHAPSSRTVRCPLFWPSNFSKVSLRSVRCFSCHGRPTATRAVGDRNNQLAVQHTAPSLSAPPTVSPHYSTPFLPADTRPLALCGRCCRADLEYVWVEQLEARFHLHRRKLKKNRWVTARSTNFCVAGRMAEEDPLADPVAVIVTLQQYQKKLSNQVELLRQDVATSKTFQSKYGVRPTVLGVCVCVCVCVFECVCVCVCARNSCGTRPAHTGHTRARARCQPLMRRCCELGDER